MRNRVHGKGQQFCFLPSLQRRTGPCSGALLQVLAAVKLVARNLSTASDVLHTVSKSGLSALGQGAALLQKFP